MGWPIQVRHVWGEEYINDICFFFCYIVLMDIEVCINKVRYK